MTQKYLSEELSGLLPTPELGAQGFFPINLCLNNNKFGPYCRVTTEVIKKTQIGNVNLEMKRQTYGRINVNSDKFKTSESNWHQHFTQGL